MGLFYWMSGFACAEGLFALVLEIYRPQATTSGWFFGIVGSAMLFLTARYGRQTKAQAAAQ